MIVTLQYYEGLSVLRAFRFRALEGAWAECKGWVEFSRHKAETRRVRYVLPCVLRRIGPSTQYVPEASHIASLTGASRHLEIVTRMWRRFNPKERRVISVRSCIQKPCRSCCFFAITVRTRKPSAHGAESASGTPPFGLHRTPGSLWLHTVATSQARC